VRESNGVGLGEGEEKRKINNKEIEFKDYDEEEKEEISSQTLETDSSISSSAEIKEDGEAPVTPDGIKKDRRLLTTIDCCKNSGNEDVARAKVQRLPVRPDKPECQFFIKSGRCAYGMKCKYNHPVERMLEVKAIRGNSEALPIRPNTEVCPYYLKTSYCKFGWMCKYTHPQSIVNERNERLRKKSVQQAPPLEVPCVHYVSMMPEQTSALILPVEVPMSFMPLSPMEYYPRASYVYFVDDFAGFHHA